MHSLWFSYARFCGFRVTGGLIVTVWPFFQTQNAYVIFRPKWKCCPMNRCTLLYAKTMLQFHFPICSSEGFSHQATLRRDVRGSTLTLRNRNWPLREHVCMGVSVCVFQTVCILSTRNQTKVIACRLYTRCASQANGFPQPTPRNDVPEHLIIVWQIGWKVYFNALPCVHTT